MKVILGSDHRGFTLKQELKKYLLENDYKVHDVGDLIPDTPDDYPDSAYAVAQEVLKDKENRGVVLCGSGVGVCITANKVKGIRAGFGYSPNQIRAAREDDDINVLALPSDHVNKSEAIDILVQFLTSEYKASERHERRLRKIEQIENDVYST